MEPGALAAAIFAFALKPVWRYCRLDTTLDRG
jgi:hypothetical protein